MRCYSCLAYLLLLPLLSGCPTDKSGKPPAARRATEALSPEIKVVLDLAYEEGRNNNSFPHPSGGFIVCSAGGGLQAAVARRDETGKVLWTCGVEGNMATALLHVDDAGRIYVISETEELFVISEEGELLWSMPKIRHWPTPDNFGNGDDNIYLLINEELKCLDRNGKVIWNRTRLGRSQTLLVDRQEREKPLLYYAALEPTQDIRYGGRLIIRMCMDSQGEGIWRRQQKVRETAYTSFFPGALAMLEDRSLVVLLSDSVFSLDGKGEATALLDEEEPAAEGAASLVGAEAHRLENGNILICNNNQRLRSGAMRILELSPAGEKLSDVTIDGTSAGFLNSGVGSAWYDLQSDRVYLFLERVQGIGKGRIAVLDRKGTKLAEYESGFGYITFFQKRSDGRVLAHREGGDLLLLP
ncbi:MAG: PQQ-binding-like beta-propeller repeat protein [bacterium]